MAQLKTGTTIGGNQAWHSGNDGAGSGLDADLLDGAGLDTGASANTVVKRDSSGDINARLFKSNFAEQGQPASTADFCFRNSTSDSYLRFTTQAGLKDYLNLGAYAPISSASTLHGDALRISGTTVTLVKGNGSSESVTLPAQTAPTTAQVGSATAGLSAGGVGSYAFARTNVGGSNIGYNAVYAGSALRATGVSLEIINNGNLFYSGAGTTLSGTWRSLGSCSSGSSDRFPST